jgi:hypothetical protein
MKERKPWRVPAHDRLQYAYSSTHKTDISHCTDSLYFRMREEGTDWTGKLLFFLRLCYSGQWKDKKKFKKKEKRSATFTEQKTQWGVCMLKNSSQKFRS